jgi:hypothetical protein
MSVISICIWIFFFTLLLVFIIIASKDVVVWLINLVCSKVYESKFKARGVDFSLDISTKRLFNLPPYIRSPHAHVFRLLHRLKLEQGLNFVDCGSGKGNILYEVSSFDFNVLGGIEINSNLHDICKKNLELILPDRQCKLINKSVLECDTEFDSFDVFYCYGLFKLDQLHEFVSKLIVSKRRHVRPIWVIYTNLVSREPFIENNFEEIYFFSRSSICDFQTVVFKHKDLCIPD